MSLTTPGQGDQLSLFAYPHGLSGNGGRGMVVQTQQHGHSAQNPRSAGAAENDLSAIPDPKAKQAAIKVPTRVRRGGSTDVVRALENRHRWLLFAQHCYTCTADEAACELGKLCSYGKKTLRHVAQCKKADCLYPRCALLKPLLQHSRRCQSNTCAICVPVWNYIQKDSAAPAAAPGTAAAGAAAADGMPGSSGALAASVAPDDQLSALAAVNLEVKPLVVGMGAAASSCVSVPPQGGNFARRSGSGDSNHGAGGPARQPSGLGKRSSCTGGESGSGSGEDGPGGTRRQHPHGGSAQQLIPVNPAGAMRGGHSSGENTGNTPSPRTGLLVAAGGTLEPPAPTSSGPPSGSQYFQVQGYGQAGPAGGGGANAANGSYGDLMAVGGGGGQQGAQLQGFPMQAFSAGGMAGPTPTVSTNGRAVPAGDGKSVIIASAPAQPIHVGAGSIQGQLAVAPGGGAQLGGSFPAGSVGSVAGYYQGLAAHPSGATQLQWVTVQGPGVGVGGAAAGGSGAPGGAAGANGHVAAAPWPHMQVHQRPAGAGPVPVYGIASAVSGAARPGTLGSSVVASGGTSPPNASAGAMARYAQQYVATQGGGLVAAAPGGAGGPGGPLVIWPPGAAPGGPAMGAPPTYQTLHAAAAAAAGLGRPGGPNGQAAPAGSQQAAMMASLGPMPHAHLLQAGSGGLMAAGAGGAAAGLGHGQMGGVVVFGPGQGGGGGGAPPAGGAHELPGGALWSYLMPAPQR